MKKDPAEPFEQELNQQDLNSSQPPEPSIQATSQLPDKQETVSNQSPALVGQDSETVETEIDGGQLNTNIAPSIKLDHSTIKLFAQQEAIDYIERNPEELRRFKRTFNINPSYRNRNKTESYKNQYGDYYVRTSTSKGDICFVQKHDSKPTDDFSFNIVQFYRCGRTPLGLELDSKG